MKRSVPALLLLLSFCHVSYAVASDKMTLFGSDHLHLKDTVLKNDLEEAAVLWRADERKDRNPAVAQVLGNWYHPKSGEWTFGFFEGFAIYDQKFWEYESFQFSGKSGRAVLKNGAERLSLKISKRGDSLIAVKIGSHAMQDYRKVAKILPAYTRADASVFKDTHYQIIDTVYVTGYLRNAPNQEPFSISYRNVVTDNNDKVFGTVDSVGRFVVKVPLLNSAEVYLDMGRMSKASVLEPGERYFLFYDCSTGEQIFMGDKARVQNELVRYNPYTTSSGIHADSEEERASKKMKGMEYLNAKWAVLSRANAYSGDYFKRNPSLSEKAKYFILNYNRYAIGADLMQKRFDLDRRNKERFPREYMTFVTDSLLTTPLAPFVLNANFSTFIRDYTDYFRDEFEGVTNSYAEALVSLIADGTVTASAEEKKVAQLDLEIERLSSIDAQRGKALAQTRTAGQSKLLMDLQVRHQDKIMTAGDQQLWLNELKFAGGFYPKIIPDEDIRDVFQARSIYQYFERTRKPMESVKFEEFAGLVKSPVFRAQLSAYNDHLLKTKNADFTFAQSIKNTDHLKSAKEADALFKELIAPYLGKVIYLDFWGTWCGPCREEMKYAGAAKEALKDKEVIFMYFANRSPEELWKSMIKDMNLTGENIVHYRLPEEQQRLIENRFSINSFPTYMLIDKEGNIVTMNAPRPSDPNGLGRAVRELLK